MPPPQENSPSNRSLKNPEIELIYNKIDALRDLPQPENLGVFRDVFFLFVPESKKQEVRELMEKGAASLTALPMFFLEEFVQKSKQKTANPNPKGIKPIPFKDNHSFTMHKLLGEIYDLPASELSTTISTNLATISETVSGIVDRLRFPSVSELPNLKKIHVQIQKNERFILGADLKQLPAFESRLRAVLSLFEITQPNFFWSLEPNNPALIAAVRILGSALIEKQLIETAKFNPRATVKDLENKRILALGYLPGSQWEELVDAKKGLAAITEENIWHTSGPHFENIAERLPRIQKWRRDIRETTKEVSKTHGENRDALKEQLLKKWVEAGDTSDEPNFIDVLIETFNQPELTARIAKTISPQKSKFPKVIRDMVSAMFLTHTKQRTTAGEINKNYPQIQEAIAQWQNNFLNTLLYPNRQDEQFTEQQQALERFCKEVGLPTTMEFVFQLAMDRLIDFTGQPQEFAENPYGLDAIKLMGKNFLGDASFGESAGKTMLYAGHRFDVLQRITQSFRPFAESAELLAYNAEQVLTHYDKQPRPPSYKDILLPTHEQIEQVREMMDPEVLYNIGFGSDILETDIQVATDHLFSTALSYAPFVDRAINIIHRFDFSNVGGLAENQFAKMGMQHMDAIFFPTPQDARNSRSGWGAFCTIMMEKEGEKIPITGVLHNGRVEVFLPFAYAEKDSPTANENRAMELVFRATMTHFIHDMLIRTERQTPPEEKKRTPSLGPKDIFTASHPIRISRFTPLGLVYLDSPQTNTLLAHAANEHYKPSLIDDYRRHLVGARAYQGLVSAYKLNLLKMSSATPDELLILQEDQKTICRRIEIALRIKHMIGEDKAKKVPPTMKMITLEDPRKPEELSEDEREHPWNKRKYFLTTHVHMKWDDQIPEVISDDPRYPKRYRVATSEAFSLILHGDLWHLDPRN